MNKDDTVAIIRSILSTTTTPYSISNLNKEFKNETGMDIPLFGYSNISNFLQSLPQDVKLTGMYPIQQVTLIANEKSGHITSLVKRQKPGKQTNKFSNGSKFNARPNRRFTGAETFIRVGPEPHLHDFKEQNKKDRSLELSRPIHLSNCLYSCESIPPIDLEQHATIGEYIEVSPCDVTNPHKFYFHFRKFKKELKEFMNGLQLFYNTNEEIPKANGCLLKPKQIYVVRHKIHQEMQWYRAEIIEVVTDSLVSVHFIDFGDSAVISKENMKFLHKNFISLPRQACLGFLANIKPKEMRSDWSISAISRFHELAFRKDLVAGVVSINTEECALGLALSFTRGLEIHINDTLVKEGHAEFEMEAVNNQSLLDFNSCKIMNGAKAFINRSKQVHEEKLCSSDVHTPVFYVSNICNSNSRLVKMFSTEE